MFSKNSIKQRSRIFLTILSVALGSLVACSSHRGEYEGGRLAFPEKRADVKPKAEVTRFLPWELWPLDIDLIGNPLRNPSMKQGDALLRAGQRAQALDSYYHSSAIPLAPAENEALVLRIASTELSLDQPNKSLATLSNYFRTTGRVVDDVDARFSLVFAYAYARRNDLDQSLAWFSRAGRVGANDPGLRAAAERGVTAVVHAVPDPQLELMTQQWAADTFVRSLVGQERSRRSTGGTIEVASLAAPWGTSNGVGPVPVVAGASTTVGVLLPLSGQYANLGKSIRNGIDLALAGKSSPSAGNPVMKVTYRDATGGPDDAVAQARQLISTDGAGILLGPLLSEHALAVGEFARQSRVPLVALAKNSNFSTGETVFRLGATSESQIRSLLAAVDERLHLKNFAIVYPDDSNGHEMADAFRAELATRGLNMVYESSYPRGNQDIFVSIAQALENSKAEGVFFPDSITTASRFFGALSPAFREQIRPLGVAMWDNPTQIANSSTVLEGAIYVSPFFAASPRPAVSQFIQAYQSAYGQAPDFLAAQGFDAFTIIAEASRRQQSEGYALPAAVRQVDTYDGLTGRITVRSDGELERQFAVVQLSAGKVAEVPEAQTPGFVMHGDSLNTLSTTVAEGVATTTTRR